MKYFPIVLFIIFIHFPLVLFLYDIPLYEYDSKTLMLGVILFTFFSLFEKSSFKKALIILPLMIILYILFSQHYNSLLKKSKVKYKELVSNYIGTNSVSQFHGEGSIKIEYLHLIYYYNNLHSNKRCVSFYGRYFPTIERCFKEEK